MAIDDGPVETMPNMSPSWISSFADLLEQLADAAGVAEVEVQVVDEDQEDAAGGRWSGARRQDDAFLQAAAAAPRRCRRGRRGSARTRRLLLDAVLEDLEVVLLQVGDELAAVVADDDVGGDQVDVVMLKSGRARILSLAPAPTDWAMPAMRAAPSANGTLRLPRDAASHSRDYNSRTGVMLTRALVPVSGSVRQPSSASAVCASHRRPGPGSPRPLRRGAPRT